MIILSNQTIKMMKTGKHFQKRAFQRWVAYDMQHIIWCISVCIIGVLTLIWRSLLPQLFQNSQQQCQIKQKYSNRFQCEWLHRQWQQEHHIHIRLVKEYVGPSQWLKIRRSQIAMKIQLNQNDECIWIWIAHQQMAPVQLRSVFIHHKTFFQMRWE